MILVSYGNSMNLNILLYTHIKLNMFDLLNVCNVTFYNGSKKLGFKA